MDAKTKSRHTGLERRPTGLRSPSPHTKPFTFPTGRGALTSCAHQAHPISGEETFLWLELLITSSDLDSRIASLCLLAPRCAVPPSIQPCSPGTAGPWGRLLPFKLERVATCLLGPGQELWAYLITLRTQSDGPHVEPSLDGPQFPQSPFLFLAWKLEG